VKGLYKSSWTSLPAPFISAQRLTELPFPSVTVCHHISTGLYRSLSAQRLSERTVQEKSTWRGCEDNIKMDTVGSTWIGFMCLMRVIGDILPLLR